ncbi:DUF2254 domain-containing protein [Flavilitoribacter nigricans]|uniref:DUF2254 domain-containing protein n=1 Tax=Flavilitoribacter nigricans (strain ATCC 23147 / DSM 23189 / NBRC 102662 / NCIMB 1420 / SS-2) TaxID=1122177 RepID=A0A2D0N960_FLAN2|nr:DUF2254 domain-containing protein [Flavilitoribacter nigricans]PHN05061.1 hypothetical protein CRP01_18730 [Flavilitoribacter nigricans DSM 23189 = NBRC 102662]
MLTKLKNQLLQSYHNIRNSIGAYPALIALVFSLAAGILLTVETPELTEEIKQKAGLLIIDNADTARSLLSTLIGGVISLTVFSFSMVMILLNQASSNYSPRLLPGLISYKPHQFVLGFYIGTILFNILCLINILPGENPYQIPGFTVLIAILLGPVCLALFVFFIHSISQSIQINNILQRLYRDTLGSLERLENKMKENHPSEDPMGEDRQWFPLYSQRYGHLMNISESDLVHLAKTQEMEFALTHPRGMAVLKGEVVLYSSKELDETTRETVFRFLHFGNQEIIEENFLFGFKQLTEILLRAMSPGINDPGTAMDALDYLTELIGKRMDMGNYLSVMDDDENPRLYLKIVPFEDLVYYCFSAIRTYIAHDPVLVQKMFSALSHLQQKEGAGSWYTTVLQRERDALWDDAQKNIENAHDLERIRTYLK